jgi:hypothetical protein
MKLLTSLFVTRRARLMGLIGLTAAVLAAPAPAMAQHRARLARNLADNLSKAAPGTLNVIVEGPQSEIDRLARAYGLAGAEEVRQRRRPVRRQPAD